jgi:pilus assembly protein CpaF
LTNEAKEYLEIVVALEMNLIVSGGTGTGKTSFLNAISRHISPDERIIVIEDTSELQLQQPHVLRFEVAAPNRKGEGRVTIRDLFHSALRMRPDRIVIGECRGGEALDLIQAMTSGHGGSMSTLHANTPIDALHRLETMALMSGIEIPLGALRSQVASAINLVVQLTRLNDGRRVVSAISEVEGTSSQDYIMNSIFERSGDGTPLRWTQNLSIFRKELRAREFTASVNRAKEIFGMADSARPN